MPLILRVGKSARTLDAASGNAKHRSHCALVVRWRRAHVGPGGASDRARKWDGCGTALMIPQVRKSQKLLYWLTLRHPMGDSRPMDLLSTNERLLFAALLGALVLSPLIAMVVNKLRRSHRKRRRGERRNRHRAYSRAWNLVMGRKPNAQLEYHPRGEQSPE
jgi:hypothetical protein